MAPRLPGREVGRCSASGPSSRLKDSGRWAPGPGAASSARWAGAAASTPRQGAATSLRLPAAEREGAPRAPGKGRQDLGDTGGAPRPLGTRTASALTRPGVSPPRAAGTAADGAGRPLRPVSARRVRFSARSSGARERLFCVRLGEGRKRRMGKEEIAKVGIGESLCLCHPAGEEGRANGGVGGAPQGGVSSGRGARRVRCEEWRWRKGRREDKGWSARGVRCGEWGIRG